MSESWSQELAESQSLLHNKQTSQSLLNCVLWTVAQNHSHCGFGVIFDCLNQIIYSSFSFTGRCAKGLVFYSQENCIVQLPLTWATLFHRAVRLEWHPVGSVWVSSAWCDEVISEGRLCVCVCVSDCFCADSCSRCSWEDVEPRHRSGSALHPGRVQRPARLHCPHPPAGHTWTSARYKSTLREYIKPVSLWLYTAAVSWWSPCLISLAEFSW